MERAESEALWPDATGRVPSFDNLEQLIKLTEAIGVRLEPQPPELTNFDLVLTWLANPAKQVPVKACLDAWNLFDDLASGAGAAFIGRRRGPVRNRVYDKLYDGSGLWQISPTEARQARQARHWRQEERRTLHRVLRQGFRLWQKYVYPVSNAAA
ncbi:hypothetical protein [Hymenobacter sp. CRA2]|uniref:hypothetical protein n=1 Tax=Hymenobacter sp. CRA2 TaxID=1955620 RepID=UPI00098F6339|nr:hypothetical protein [Hymenobacter sp. CRA2]OON68571.1 hypothetical protein B0919_13100 [Hymenobacter sp. CRA2]